MIHVATPTRVRLSGTFVSRGRGKRARSAKIARGTRRGRRVSAVNVRPAKCIIIALSHGVLGIMSAKRSHVWARSSLSIPFTAINLLLLSLFAYRDVLTWVYRAAWTAVGSHLSAVRARVHLPDVYEYFTIYFITRQLNSYDNRTIITRHAHQRRK